MTVKRKPYNTYTKEFKLEILSLMENSDRTASEGSIGSDSLLSHKRTTIMKLNIHDYRYIN